MLFIHFKYFSLGVEYEFQFLEYIQSYSISKNLNPIISRNKRRGQVSNPRSFHDRSRPCVVTKVEAELGWLWRFCRFTRQTIHRHEGGQPRFLLHRWIGRWHAACIRHKANSSSPLFSFFFFLLSWIELIAPFEIY